MRVAVARLAVSTSDEPSNKELKLTKPGQIGASQLNSSVRRTPGGNAINASAIALGSWSRPVSGRIERRPRVMPRRVRGARHAPCTLHGIAPCRGALGLLPLGLLAVATARLSTRGERFSRVTGWRFIEGA